MLDFCPFSLYNMLYRVIAKVIANRLKGFLPHIISESQSAFVPECQILDNILIVYELLHFLRIKRKVKQEYMLIKLNMSKTYDRVEWNYLRKVMGFESRFIDLIMSCVSSASFSMLVNGSPKGHIIPSRGLQQGDLLSLYLFLFCTECLISLLSNSNYEYHVREQKFVEEPLLLTIYYLQTIMCFFIKWMWISTKTFKSCWKFMN